MSSGLVSYVMGLVAQEAYQDPNRCRRGQEWGCCCFDGKEGDPSSRRWRGSYGGMPPSGLLFFLALVGSGYDGIAGGLKWPLFCRVPGIQRASPRQRSEMESAGGLLEGHRFGGTRAEGTTRRWRASKKNGEFVDC